MVYNGLNFSLMGSLARASGLERADHAVKPNSQPIKIVNPKEKNDG
jgi:hypothetical protein